MNLMLYIAYDQLLETLARALEKAGFDSERAASLAEIFAGNSLEGVYSHGVNRFPRFINDVENHIVDINARPECVGSLGGMRVWDGHFGVGPLIAQAAMDEAIALCRVNGIACVCVRNSNHWMRPGRYGRQAARAGVIGMCWSNTCANMPAWGATDPRLGNNPIVLAIPREKGDVVIDTALSQFAYGKLEVAKLSGKMLPIEGGYDTHGRLTRDPGEILASRRTLPIGYWKGSALSIALDLIAAGASLGRSVSAISRAGGTECGLSQVFIAINFRAVVNAQAADHIFDDAIGFLLSSTPAPGQPPVRYPGQNMAAIRAENLQKGVPVNEATWQKVLDLAAR